MAARRMGRRLVFCLYTRLIGTSPKRDGKVFPKPVCQLMKQMISARKLLRRHQLSKIVVLVFLLVLVGVVAIPGYATGRWPWTNPLPVANLTQLRSLRQNGMAIPGWEVIRVQNNVQIGGHRWLVEEIKNHQNGFTFIFKMKKNY